MRLNYVQDSKGLWGADWKVGFKHFAARYPQTISFQLVTRMAGNFSHLGLAEQFFLANLEIFILEGPLHDRYIRPLHRRG